MPPARQLHPLVRSTRSPIFGQLTLELAQKFPLGDGDNPNRFEKGIKNEIPLAEGVGSDHRGCTFPRSPLGVRQGGRNHTLRCSAIGGQERFVLGDRQQVSQSCRRGTFCSERSGRARDGRGVVCGKCPTSTSQRDGADKDVRDAACRRHSRFMRHWRREGGCGSSNTWRRGTFHPVLPLRVCNTSTDRHIPFRHTRVAGKSYKKLLR